MITHRPKVSPLRAANSLQNLLAPLILDEESTVQSLVYEALSELLVSGQLQPGEDVSLRHAAAALGVSVTPVREALRQLEREGALVPAGKNRAFQVPSLPAAYVSEICVIRIQLEGMAAENAAGLVTHAQLRVIENAMKLTENAIAAHDLGDFLKHNWRFHSLIYEAAGMPVLMRLIEGLWLRIGPGVRFALDQHLLSGQSVRCHRAAYEALKARDGAGARAAISEDIRSAAENLLALRASEPKAWPGNAFRA